MYETIVNTVRIGAIPGLSRVILNPLLAAFNYLVNYITYVIASIPRTRLSMLLLPSKMQADPEKIRPNGFEIMG